MNKIKSIVVPVDFLKTTDKLVEYAIYMAAELSATIHFIHVVDLYSGDAGFGVPYIQDCRERLLVDAKLRMSNLVTDSREQCTDCSGEVVAGDPVDKITEIARERNCQLIVIGTHGAKGLEKILLGSVAERVLKRAHCPVLIMNPFKK
jgi:nucleotide-binding universal stress UspA family protein